MTAASEPHHRTNQEPRRPDITSPADVDEMVRRFYGDVAQDELLGPLFNDVAQVDWSEHIPKLAQFWKRALLDLPGYEGNPFQQHLHVHQQSPFRPEHFDRWLTLFNENLDLRWSGPVVEQAKTLANNVAQVHSRQLSLRSTNPAL